MKPLASWVVRCLASCFSLLFFGLLLLVVFLPKEGFSETSSSVTLTPDDDGMQRVIIKMESYSFSPNEIIIQAGKPVNPAMGLHYEIDISAGDTVNFQLLFTTPGTYTFYCDKQLLFFPSHREEGMEGHLVVR